MPGDAAEQVEDAVELPGAVLIAQVVQQVGPAGAQVQHRAQVQVDQRQREALAELRQPVADAAEPGAQVVQADLAELGEVEGRAADCELGEVELQAAEVEAVQRLQAQAQGRAHGQVEAADAQGERDVDRQVGNEIPAVRQAEGEELVDGQAVQRAELQVAARALDEVELDAQVQRDGHVGGAEVDHAEARLHARDGGVSLGADAQALDVEDDRLVGREAGREIDTHAQRAGDAGLHVHLERAQAQALVRERGGGRVFRRALADVERVVHQRGAGRQRDLEPHDLVAVGHDLQAVGDGGRVEGAGGGNGALDQRLHLGRGLRRADRQRLQRLRQPLQQRLPGIGERGQRLLQTHQFGQHGVGHQRRHTAARGRQLGRVRRLGDALRQHGEALEQGVDLGGGQGSGVGGHGVDLRGPTPAPVRRGGGHRLPGRW